MRDTLRRQVDAWNRGEIRGFLDGYHHSPETTFLSGGAKGITLTRGFDAMAARYEGRYPPGKQGTLEFVDVEVHPIDADAAWVLGRYRLTGDVTQSGAFTLVLRRMEGRFVIVHDHTTAETPPS